jgi:hypothetical protein
MHQWVTSLGIMLKGTFDQRPSLRARDWNEKIVAPCLSAHLVPGAYTTVVRTPTGQTLNIDPAAGWRHPWFVTVAGWSKKGLLIRMRPGFINGEAPTVTRLPSPVSLLDAPAILVGFNAWRPIDGTEEKIPKFFERLGVQSAAPAFQISEGGVSVDTTERASKVPPRTLVACDIWVAVARATYQAQVTVTDPTGLSGQIVDYEVGYDTRNLDRVGPAPRIQLGRFVAVREPTFAERLMGLYTDEGEDRILISTIYLLSPEDRTDYDIAPDWQFFRANNCFWNLHHAARNVPPKANPPPIRIFTGLLGGIGDLIGNQLLAPLNELSDRIIGAANNTSNAGQFWNA